MKRKIILFFSAIIVLIAIAVAIKLNNTKKEISGNIDASDDNQSENTDNEVYDENGLIVVSIETHPELFSFEKDLEETEPYSGNDSMFEITFSHEVTDPDGNITYKSKDYDLFDENVKLEKSAFEGYSFKTYFSSNAGVMINFQTGAFDKAYKLVIPETYNEKDVVSVLGISEDEYIQEIEYPDLCSDVSINDCPNLKKLSYSDNVYEIQITGCYSLESVELNDDIKVISGVLYDNNAVTDIKLSNEALILAISFSDCQALENVTFDDNLMIIDQSFSLCPVLNNIILPENVFLINYSFNNCDLLDSVYVPDSVTFISNSFNNCPNLVLSVGEGSYAESYAIENDIDYIYH
jgi:hypothetical protein